MKITRIILILILITLTFFFKNEILSFKDNIQSYFFEEDYKISNFEQENIPIANKINLSGALRSTVNTIINNNIKLSKENIMLFTNEDRKENGDLSPLMENEKLNLSAQKKLEDMFANQYFEHISPNGEGVSDLSKEAGYEYILIGENLAMGDFKDDRALMDAWMASPGHRANILNPKYTEIGIAVGKGRFEGNDIWMAVSHFGTPLTICPTINTVLYRMINSNQKEANEMEEDLNIRKKKIEGGFVYEGNTTSEQIKKYNELVNIYNYLIKKIKEEINKYNDQVILFNDCVKENQ